MKSIRTISVMKRTFLIVGSTTAAAELIHFDNGTVHIRYEVKPRKSSDGP